MNAHKMKFLAITLAALAGITIVVLLMMYAVTEPKEGTVTRKQFDPAWTSTTWNCVTRNKNGLCTSSVPSNIYHPECYRIIFYNAQRDRKGSSCVAPSEYDSYNSGDTYPR